MTRQRFQLACVASIVALLLVNGWDLAVPGLRDRSGRMKCPDFLQFYTYGTLVRTGQYASLYDGDAHARIAKLAIDPSLALTGLRPNYSPVIAWLMAPLAVLPYLSAMAVWAVISCVFYGLAVVLLLRCTPYLREESTTMWLAVAAWPAIFVVLRYGQISALSLLLVAAAANLSTRRRSLASGFVLGCLIYKPQLLVAPGLILALAGEWTLVAGVAAGAMAETLVAVASVGPVVYSQYLHQLATQARHPEVVQMFATESHSVSGALQLLLPSAAIAPFVTAAAIALTVWAGTRVWRKTTDERRRWAALVLASLLSSPHLLTYDLLLLAVPLLLMADWCRERTGDWPRGMSLTALVLMFAGAWPGTLVARLYSLQLSTIGMGLGLALLLEQSQHQLVGREAEHDVVDGSAT